MKRLTSIFICLTVTGLLLAPTASFAKNDKVKPKDVVDPVVPTIGTGQVLFNSNRPIAEGDARNHEIYVMNADGTNQVRLTTDGTYDTWWPKISPDRTKILFVRTPAGVHDSDYRQVTTWVMDADGANQTEILPHGAYDWTFQGHPEWSPDGTKIVTMCHGGESSGVFPIQICTVDSDGTDPFMVTNKAASTQVDPFENGGGRGGSNLDPSWSPDGQYIIFIGCPVFACVENEYELYRIGADGTGELRLTFNLHRDHDAYYSPDGSTIAYLKNSGGVLLGPWGIYKIDANDPPTGYGDAFKEVAIIDDGSINSKPGWGLDSHTIWFHRWELGTTLFDIWRINKDGTGLAEVVSSPKDPFLGRFGTYDNEFPVNSSF